MLVWQPKGSLVQRELSAKLTEGLSYLEIDIFADTTEVAHDFVIRYANNGDIVLLQIACSLSAFLDTYRIVVLRAVQFNYEPGFRAVEVYDISTQYFLTQKANIVVTQKIIPQMPLFLGHVLSEGFCVANEAFVVLDRKSVV